MMLAIAGPMSGPGKIQHAWLEQLLSETGRNLNEIAQAAGIDAANLYRFRERGGTHALRRATIDKIAAAVGSAPPGGSADNVIGFAESQGAFTRTADTMAGETFEHVVSMQQAAAELDLLTGDVLLVDRQRPWGSGDLVLARNMRAARPADSMIIRLFDKPWLLSGSLKEGRRKPILLDDEIVCPVGVVVSKRRSM